MTTPQKSYCLLPLTQGQFAKVSPHRYDSIAQYKWCAYWCEHTKSFYAGRQMKLPDGKRYFQSMHREILGLLKGDKRQGDHINKDTLDNRDENLRVCERIQNSRNSGRQSNNSTGYIGVYRAKARKKIVLHAKIRVDDDLIHLGTFPLGCEIQAAKVRDEAAKRYFGEFAHLNFP